MTDNKDGIQYLAYVLDKLRQRIAEISQSIAEGQKEIDGMHEYYWENYTEMDQYGYENFDNQQALFHQISANEQQLHLKSRFRKMLDKLLLRHTADPSVFIEKNTAVAGCSGIQRHNIFRHIKILQYIP